MKVLTGKPSVDKPWLQYYSKEAKNAQIPEMTVYDYLKVKNKNLNRVALNYYRKITYGEMFDRIDEVMRSLLNKNVRKGDIVSIMAPTLPEVVYLFYALSRIGAAANMIDPRKSPEEIEEYVKEVDSKLLFVVDVMSDKVSNIKKNSIVSDIILMSPADSLPAPLKAGYKVQNMIQNVKEKKLNSYAKSGECESWSEFIKQGKSVLLNRGYDLFQKNMPLAIMRTGGTTGKAKGAVLTNENFNSAALQCILAGYDFKPEHNWLDIMPPFIAYGLGNGLHLPLVCGMEVVLIPQFDPEKFANLMIKYRPNHMTGVPSHYKHLIDHPKLKKKDLSYVIAPTVGGDKMQENLEEETNAYLKKKNCAYKVVKGYGMTEVNAAVAACISNEVNAIGSVGIPFPKTIISIFDPETGEELGYNEQGEVCITGPNTMLGYYHNPNETEHILRKHKDGKIWVHSGDLGYMTENGFLYITDRMKRMIIRSDGFKVVPSDIEKVLSSHSAVETCCVVGVDNLKYAGQGQIPFANIVLKEEYKNFGEQIKNELFLLCKEKLAEYVQPEYIEYYDSLPLTSIGKIDFLSLQAQNNEYIKSLFQENNQKVKTLTKAK